MIQVYIEPRLQKKLNSILEEVLDDNELSLDFDEMNQSSYDIYFIEIKTVDDIVKIEKIDRTYSPLVYVIGLREYDLISHAVSKNIHMYFDKDNLIKDFLNKKEDIRKQVDKKCRSYLINRGPIKIKLRVSQIIYVESMNHEIIIHSTTGEIIERKALSQFIESIHSIDFIQVHKSFVVNSLYINEVKNKHIILKDGTVIPIGKKYGQMTIDF